MALQPIIAGGDGPRVTVNDLVKAPKAIPVRIIALLENQFLADTVLRDGGSNSSGVITYRESEPLFAPEDVGIREEFGEYPILTDQTGTVKAVTTVDRGFSVLISEKMRRRNQMDRITIQMTRGKNTMLRTWDKALRDALLAACPTMPATAAWDVTGAKIRQDLIEAKKTIIDASVDSQAENYFGFDPNTVIMHTDVAHSILLNEAFDAVNVDDMRHASVKFTGKLPNQIVNLTILTSRSWPTDKVWVGERNTVGFVSDEVALNSTPLYKPNPVIQAWRTDTGREAAIAIDQPKAGLWITGVVTP